MKLLPRLSAVAFLTIAIAWALSYLPGIEQKSMGPNQEMTVFRGMKPISLSHDNLVDWVIEMPIKLELNKVDWSHNILAMDFRMNEQAASPDDIYAQMLDSMYQGLAGTTNVDRVQIRIFDPVGGENGKLRLLLALDAERGKFRETDYERWRDKKLSAEEWLNARFQLTQTSRWEQMKSELKGHAK